MANTIRKNLGMVTAYAYAVSKGYTGTEEEFAELMASYADVAQDAEASAQAAAQSATTAEQKATQAAGSATNAAVSATSASESAQAAAGSSNSANLYAQNASASATNAAGSASSASTYAGNASASAQAAEGFANDAQTSATQAAGSATTATAKAGEAATSATTAVEAAQRAEDAAATLVIDDTLTHAGQAADAKKTGDEIGDLKENLTDLQELADTRAAAIYETASGEIASFSDGADDMPMKSCVVSIEPVQDLHGYDNPWPAGGGKNLVDADTIYASIKQSDGSFIGTPSGIYSRKIPVTESMTGKTLTLSALVSISSGGSTITGVMVYANVNGKNVLGNTITANSYAISSVTFTPTSMNDYFGITYSGSSSANSYINFKEVQLEEGSEHTPYAPYENVCTINGHTGLSVTWRGKNLIDDSIREVNATKTSLFIGAKVNEFIHLKAGTYTLSCNFTETHYGAFIKSPNKSQVIIWPQTGEINQATFTLSDGDYRLWFYQSSELGGISPDGINNVMLTVGDTALPYEPIKGNTYPVNWETEAGSVYGGSLDVVSGKLTVDRAIYTLDGSTLKFTGVFNRGTKKAFGISIEGTHHTNSGSKVLISNILTWTSDWYTSMHDWTYGSEVGISSNHMFAFDDTVTTIEEANALLAKWNTEGNPLTVTLLLATPITYALTPQEVRTLLGENNIWADSGNILELEYTADTKTYIDTKIAEAVAAAMA